jgi:ParB family chromosome partitioning protein
MSAATSSWMGRCQHQGKQRDAAGIVHRREEGSVHFLVDQRSSRASVEAGRPPLLPVMIIASPEEAECFVTPDLENVQRAELSEASCGCGRAGLLCNRDGTGSPAGWDADLIDRG